MDCNIWLLAGGLGDGVCVCRAVGIGDVGFTVGGNELKELPFKGGKEESAGKLGANDPELKEDDEDTKGSVEGGELGIEDKEERRAEVLTCVSNPKLPELLNCCCGVVLKVSGWGARD